MRWRAPVALMSALTFAGGGLALAAPSSAARHHRRHKRHVHPATPGAHYAGKTKQKKPISFDVSADGNTLVHPILYLLTSCGSGHSYAQTSSHLIATASGPIKAGRFHLRFSESAKVKGGATATAKFTLRGHFTTAKRARGVAMVNVHYSTGANCSSGPVGFRVRT